MQQIPRRLHFRDAHIAYESFGSAEDRAVLLLHGAFLSGLAWLPLVNTLLSQNYFVIVPDLRGHGDSGPITGDWSMMDFAEDIYLMLAHLGIEQAAVVGHSLGAMIALGLAAHYSWQVLGLALLDPCWPRRGFWSTVFSYLPTSMKTQQIAAWYGQSPIAESTDMHHVIQSNLARIAQGRPEWQATWMLLRDFDANTIAPKIQAHTTFLVHEHELAPKRPEAHLATRIKHAELRVFQFPGRLGQMTRLVNAEVELSDCLRSFFREESKTVR